MADEHRCQQPEGYRLCANNCGFFGSPATMNLCSKCYRDFILNGKQQASIQSAISASTSGAQEAREEAGVAQVNRCSVCRKRVGLTGFRCRCGNTFCGVHRYPEKHECSFDFKELGRENLARANPVFKPQKLDKI